MLWSPLHFFSGMVLKRSPVAIRAAQVSCLSSVPSTVKLDQLDRHLFSPSGIQSLIFFFLPGPAGKLLCHKEELSLWRRWDAAACVTPFLVTLLSWDLCLHRFWTCHLHPEVLTLSLRKNREETSKICYVNTDYVPNSAFYIDPERNITYLNCFALTVSPIFFLGSGFRIVIPFSLYE